MKNKIMYTLTGGGGSSSSGKSVTASPKASGWMALSAFTMAEILLSLTIIGVVAAITLPSLTGNINERTWNTQRKALYARFSQAISLMPALNGYGTLKEASSEGASDAVDTAAETFVTAGLAKVLKINNICDSNHIADCGIPTKFTTLTGSVNVDMPITMGDLNSKMVSLTYEPSSGWAHSGSYSAINTKAVAFETQNGESIMLYYNPSCVANMGENDYYFVMPKICVNMVYDLNGTKGPNTVGKDIGIMTVLYPTDSVVVAPVPFRTMLNNVSAAAAPTACTEKAGSEYRIPTRDEVASLFINNEKMLGADVGSDHWLTSTKFVTSSGGTSNWLMRSERGEFRHNNSATSWSVFCVQR